MNESERGAAESAIEAAASLGGVVHGVSAALVWGWSVRHLPARPEVTVPAGRHLSRQRTKGITVRRLDLGAVDIDGPVTSRVRTVLDCARQLPFTDALCIADSALNHGLDQQLLIATAEHTLGPRAAAARRIAHLAHGGAASLFESCLRAIAIQVPGLHVVPQVRIEQPTFLGRPDLVDEHLRVIIEADSFEWHGSRPALVADAQRYNRFVANGWVVLRFTWEDVMHNPAYVEEILRGVVRERTSLAG
ncbi:MAG: DUF559 domain-containing protein [Nocardioides sp.]|nr:DUF559 domain-containing protein [Nocardioides sp.]